MDELLLGRLRINEVFRGLSDEEIEDVVQCGQIEEHESGEIIYELGERLDSIYIVVKGRLKISSKVPGKDLQTLRYVGPGDQFGGLIALLTDEYLAVQASVDERVMLLRIRSDQAHYLGDRYPILRRNILKKVGLSFKNTLLQQRKRNLAKLVVFLNVDDDSRPIIGEIAKQLSQCEKVGIIGNPRGVDFGDRCQVQPVIDDSGKYLTEAQVRETIYNWRDVERVIVVLEEQVANEHKIRFVDVANIVFSLSTTQNSDKAFQDLRQLYRTEPSWKKKTHFVWILNNEEQVAPLNRDLLSLVERDFKIHMATAGERARLGRQGIRRVVHYLRGISVGVALSGGAAHGMAHLGVLKALDEAGLTIDRVAGTSAGVLTALVYCAGLDPDFGVEQFANDLTPGSVYRYLPKGDGFYLLRKYRGHQWDPMLRPYFFDWCLEQLPIPLSSVTTDLISAEPVVRTTGDAIDATLESINLPILANPISRDGMLLVDGVFVDNLPADLLVKQGCKFVIGVDVAKNLEKKFGKNTPNTSAKDMVNPGIVSTLLRCLQIQAHNLSDVGARAADVIIAPDVSQFDPTSFVKAKEMAAIGYETTQKSLPRIREILADLDSGLFGET